MNRFLKVTIQVFSVMIFQTNLVKEPEKRLFLRLIAFLFNKFFEKETILMSLSLFAEIFLLLEKYPFSFEIQKKKDLQNTLLEQAEWSYYGNFHILRQLGRGSCCTLFS